MTVETRYMRNDAETVDGATYYKLRTSQTAFHLERTRAGTGGPQSVRWGIRIWKYGGSEITNGTPVAQVLRTVNGSGMQSATWNCPETANVNRLDIRVYTQFGGGTWQETEKFITEDLGGVTLDAATWTVYYWTWRDYTIESGVTEGHYRFGDSTENSRIENFSWSSGVPPPIAQPLGDGLTWVG